MMSRHEHMLLDQAKVRRERQYTKGPDSFV